VGTFKHPIDIAASADGPFRSLDALVDTGPLYTCVPARTLRELGLEPTDRIEFLLANGQRELRDGVEALVRLDGRIRHTVCIFGGDRDLVLLGADTREGFGFAADPVNKRLVPMATIPAALAAGPRARREQQEGGTP
jgi:predicted aspartyl protease